MNAYGRLGSYIAVPNLEIQYLTYVNSEFVSGISKISFWEVK